MRLHIFNLRHSGPEDFYFGALLNFQQNKFQHPYIGDLSRKNVLRLMEIIERDIITSLKDITLKEDHLKILNCKKNELCKFIYDEIFLGKKYDDSYLKLFLLIHDKYYLDGEVLYLLRFLLEKCESDIFIKVLIYNFYFFGLYGKYGTYTNTELFENDYYKSNRSNFVNYSRPFAEEENYFYAFRCINLKKVEFDMRNLSLSVFYCKYNHVYLSGDNWEDDQKKLNYINHELKEKYIGKVKWLNEYSLYKNTKLIFKNSNIKVLREYSPEKLKGQRLDIYFEINNNKIAFEYQGEQHYKCIDFFGGEEGYIKRKKLDSLKKSRCKRIGISLIEFKYNEDLSINSILNKLKNNHIKLEGENICLKHLS